MGVALFHILPFGKKQYFFGGNFLRIFLQCLFVPALAHQHKLHVTAPFKQLFEHVQQKKQILLKDKSSHKSHRWHTVAGAFDVAEFLCVDGVFEQKSTFGMLSVQPLNTFLTATCKIGGVQRAEMFQNAFCHKSHPFLRMRCGMGVAHPHCNACTFCRFQRKNRTCRHVSMHNVVVVLSEILFQCFDCTRLENVGKMKDSSPQRGYFLIVRSRLIGEKVKLHLGAVDVSVVIHHTTHHAALRTADNLRHTQKIFHLSPQIL